MSPLINQESSTRSSTIAICGNPNCGKTSIFNAITGLSQQVGNYPGVTVEKVSGRFHTGPDKQSFTLVDIPGTYSLAAFSPDEYIAASALFGRVKKEPAPDAVVCVIDATNLDRSLYLVFQIMQTGLPMVVALNMVDVTKRRGITVDYDRLSEILGGVPVIPVVGSRGRGIEELKTAIAEVHFGGQNYKNRLFEDVVEGVLKKFEDTYSKDGRSRAEYLRALFDIDGPAEVGFVGDHGKGSQEFLQAARHEIRSGYGSLTVGETKPLTDRARSISQEVCHTSGGKTSTRSEKIDRVLLHPFFGPAILIGIMIVVFQSIFSWSKPFMDLIDSSFGSLAGIVQASMVDGPLRSLLTDGVIGGAGSVLIFLPQIIILFLFIALLEDSGYMARAAFLVDRMFRWCGLSGKSFIPMLSSFACAVPGIMATRTIEDRKLRLMTIMVAPLMTCSARLPVYAILIAAFIPYQSYFGLFNLQGMVLTALYALGLVVAVVVSFILKKTVLKTERGTFLMEMPSYKVPTIRSVLIRITNRAKSFILRAGTVILAITIVIWALSYYPRMDSSSAALQTQEITETLSEEEAANIQAGEQLRQSYFGRFGRTVQPLFEPLGWDWKITMSVLASFPAREVIIATLGTIYNLGEVSEETSSLKDKMRNATWEDGAKVGQKVYSPAVALSIMVFFALCCQCGATVVTIKQETGGWGYPIFTFAYMTTLAYVAGLGTYQFFIRVWF